MGLATSYQFRSTYRLGYLLGPLQNCLGGDFYCSHRSYYLDRVSNLIAEQYQRARLFVVVIRNGGGPIVDPTVTVSSVPYFYLFINFGALVGQIGMNYSEKGLSSALYSKSSSSAEIFTPVPLLQVQSWHPLFVFSYSLPVINEAWLHLSSGKMRNPGKPINLPG
ncbi:hypothetical protein BYT27DRAFT_7336473 [Phlegmacium glaucopus]|nr:hypothetical protein BYT27DRAFT_7336473 [Phlegmacium glaucopus]